MIPYVEIPTYSLGPFTIRVWGVLVAMGFIIGMFIARKRVATLGLDPVVVDRISLWIIIGSLVFARLGHCFFYRPGYYLDDPLEILMVHHGGMSSFGGFLGAVIGGVGFMLKEKISFWSHADPLIFGFAPGWAIGRIGCFLIHDHPGNLTDFFLAVDYPAYVYPPGGPRHNLGLYDSILCWIITIVFLVLRKKELPKGTYLAIFLFMYGSLRFLQDFLRATDLASSDARYLGLTPGHYGSLVLLACGAYVLVHVLKHKNDRLGPVPAK
jgi:phosphatidylglycerol---prolipoprotein diacylglyceryl transferase